MMKKVLVTGGTGFLGSYILEELLNNGYTVRAIRRSSKLPKWISPTVLEKVEWVEGDILDIISLEDAMVGVGAVVHSAALVSFVKKDKDLLYQLNVEGTANVVNAALEKNIQRLVHISSVAALGRKAGGHSVDETAKWEENPLQTHYARSKFKGELQAWRGYSEGLDTVILNPSTILGYGDWTQSSCAIFKQVHDGFGWYTSGLNGFVDVKDVARVTRLLLEQGKSGERYVVNGATWTFRELQNTISDGFGKKRPSRKAPTWLLDIAWRLEAVRSLLSGKKPLLTKETARVAVSQTQFENRKILATLPEFEFTPLTETIHAACKKYEGQ
ncbi:MAG: NAD-dependent epimerase/dehydratase family protein [Chitinophagaceae bacterium]